MLLKELNYTKIPRSVEQKAVNYFTGEGGLIEGGYNWTLLVERLKKLGWKNIMAGKFSSVFINPRKSYVIKVTHRSDRGYNHYIDVIHRYNNIHFPKISDMKTLDVDGDPYSIYLIEKLYHIRNIKILDILLYGLERISTKWREPLPQIFDPRIAYDSKDTLTYFQLDANAELVEAARIVGKERDRNWLDIHDNNIMQREDGTIVITDPYS